MEELTYAQQSVIDEIKDYMFDYGRPPTYEEIADRLGCTVNNVYEHVCRIEEKGYLWRSGVRGIVFTDQTICPYCRRGFK